MAKKKVSTKKHKSATSYRTNSKPSSVSPSTASSPSPQLQDPVVTVRRRKGTPVRSPSHNDPSKGIVFSFRIQTDSEMSMAVDIRSYDQQLRDDDVNEIDHDLEQGQQHIATTTAAVAAAGGVQRAPITQPGTVSDLKDQKPLPADHTPPAIALASSTTASGHKNCDNSKSSNNVPVSCSFPSSSSFSSSSTTAAVSTRPSSAVSTINTNSASAAPMTVAEWEQRQQQVGPGSSGLTKVGGSEWSSNPWSYRENNVMDLSRNLLVLHARHPPCRAWTTSSPALPSSSLKSRSVFHPYSKLTISNSSSSTTPTSPLSASPVPSTPALSASSSASASPASSPSSPTLCQSPEREFLGKDDLELLAEAPTAPAAHATALGAIPSELLTKNKSRILTVRGLGGGRARPRMEVIVVS